MNIRQLMAICTTLLALTHSGAEIPDRPVPATPSIAAITPDLNVLVIGDSNTEIGHITGGLARIFESKYGYSGSGYHSLNAAIGMGQGYLPYLKIANDDKWELYTMLWPKAAPKPYLAPEGTCIRGQNPGALTTVEFFGTAIDIYWLAEVGGGKFTAAVDGMRAQVISTEGEERAVRRTQVTELTAGWHSLALTVESSTVTLLGVDACNGALPPVARAVVHKWGKGWATSKDFVDVDPVVFRDALKLVNPDLTVIILGTNDHNLGGYNRDQYAANLREIVARVRAAVPGTRLLLVSTAQVNSPWSNNGLKEYLGILPELCAELGASYWDMSTWFGGPWAKNNDEGLMLDGVHVNEKGGEKIAGQLYEEILKVAKEKPAMPKLRSQSGGRTVGKPPADSAIPRQIPGLSAWWRAQGQVVVDDAGNVIRWLDASGNDADAIAPWASSRPQYVTNAVDGRPLLHFDGKTSHLLFPMQTEAQTIFVVLRANNLILGHPYFNTRPFHPGVVRPGKAFSQNYASKAVTGGEGFLNGAKVHIGDDQDDALEFSAEQLQVFSLVMTDKTPFSYLGWGGSWNFNRYLNGDVAELLVYSRALSDSERRQIEKYLAASWKIGIAPEKP